MVLENHLELVSLFGGCGYAGLTLFGVNTGLRGEVLSGVLNHSKARLLVVDERFWPEVERVAGDLEHLAPENILVLRTGTGPVDAAADLRACVDREIGAAGHHDTRDAVVTEFLQEVESVHVRQVRVDEHEIGAEHPGQA